MDILRSISHNSIGASPHTVVQAAIYHHTKVLCFIDDHMACFPHRIGFLDPFIDICHRRKVVHIKRCIWYFDRNSLLLLCTEKILIKSSHGTIPFSVAKVSAVFFVQYFPLFFCELLCYGEGSDGLVYEAFGEKVEDSSCRLEGEKTL